MNDKWTQMITCGSRILKLVAHSLLRGILALCQVLAVGETASYCCETQLTFSAVEHNMPVECAHTQVQDIDHNKVNHVEGN